MTNNDVLRRVRYIFDYNDKKMMEIFACADFKVTRETLSQWLKKDDDENFVECKDVELASFLNGFINDKRGKREGDQPAPEEALTNNIVLRKLSIALNLKSEDVLEVLLKADLRVGKHELSAFFRKPDHKNYRECKAQILRNFLVGLQVKFREEI